MKTVKPKQNPRAEAQKLERKAQREQRKLRLKAELRRHIAIRRVTHTQIAAALGVAEQHVDRMLDDQERVGFPLHDLDVLERLMPGLSASLFEAVPVLPAADQLTAVRCLIKEATDVINAATRTLSGQILPSMAGELEREIAELRMAEGKLLATTANHTIAEAPVVRAVDSSRSSR